MKKFFVDLYNKFIGLSWVQWTIDYCKENPLMAGIVGGSALAVLLLLIIIGIVSSKRRKKRKAAAKKAKEQPIKTETKEAPAKAAPAPAPAPAVEASKPVEAKQTAPVVEEVKPVATPKQEAPVAKKKEEPAPTPKKEEAQKEVIVEPVEPITAEIVEEVAPAAAPVEAPVEEKVEKIPAPAKKVPEKKQTKAKEVEEVLAAVENADENEPEQLSSHYDEDETEKQAKYKGKWTICRVLTDDEQSEEMFFFELHASNGEKLLSSEEYTTYQGALRGIQTHKSNILKRNLKITLSKKGDYIFKLLSGKNMLLCMGENYPSKARCESAIESTVRFAETAVIDENVQDIVIKVPKEEDTPLPPVQENSKGKWIISSAKNADDEDIFFFELFANNGEKLLSSEEYTTYTGAVNGIETHRKNIQQNNFRISLTKRGDYIYKLLNGNGQLLCLGEHYKTKRLCQSAVDSVQRFALNSPVLTSDKK